MDEELHVCVEASSEVFDERDGFVGVLFTPDVDNPVVGGCPSSRIVRVDVCQKTRVFWCLLELEGTATLGILGVVEAEHEPALVVLLLGGDIGLGVVECNNLAASVDDGIDEFCAEDGTVVDHRGGHTAPCEMSSARMRVATTGVSKETRLLYGAYYNTNLLKKQFMLVVSCDYTAVLGILFIINKYEARISVIVPYKSNKGRETLCDKCNDNNVEAKRRQCPLYKKNC